ncbi:RidA family protein [Cryobacterium sp. PH31-O1]|uniref:RidA family protein n=1 Tax=Cryobacterium sp. PH31-O1 TaxID=3046306 RepID=UPI0024BB5484|nr:RidA family protein [Cryobacterium sp. PH31-O1]MDJ0336703.1 RidA family protein [Cryobacterium sp. PH31-O1]
MTIQRTQFADGKPRPYAASASTGGIVFLCGQIPSYEDGTVPEGIAAQVDQTFNNMEAVLHEAGSSLSYLLKLTVYLVDLDEFDQYNAAYLTRLTGFPLPPRTTVEVARFRGKKRIEIDAVAATHTSLTV